MPNRILCHSWCTVVMAKLGVGRMFAEPGNIFRSKTLLRASRLAKQTVEAEDLLQRLAAIRPSLPDVERCTRAIPRSRRGIGSRHVPHRLNSQEHELYLVAQRRGFAVVKGAGGRRERKGSPLLNCLRQRADALAQPLIWVEQYKSASASVDQVSIDYSPLRSLEATELSAAHARSSSVAAIMGIGAAPVAADYGGAGLLPVDVQPPWATDGESGGAVAVLPPIGDTLSRPIWALRPTIARFVFSWRADAPPLPWLDRKISKRLAAALAAEFGTMRSDSEQWHEAGRGRVS